MKRNGIALAAGLTLLAVLYLLLPGNNLLVLDMSEALGGTELTDAFGHLVLFAMLSAAWSSVSLRYFHLSLRRALLVSAAFCLVLGASTEFLQQWVPKRGSSIWDFLADALGVSIFSIGVVVQKHHRIVPTNSETRSSL